MGTTLFVALLVLHLCEKRNPLLMFFLYLIMQPTYCYEMFTKDTINESLATIDQTHHHHQQILNSSIWGWIMNATFPIIQIYSYVGLLVVTPLLHVTHLLHSKFLLISFSSCLHLCSQNRFVSGLFIIFSNHLKRYSFIFVHKSQFVLSCHSAHPFSIEPHVLHLIPSLPSIWLHMTIQV